MALFKLLWFETRMTLMWLILISGEAISANNETQPIAIFRSRPDIQAPILTPLLGLHDPSKMAPGYYFVSPYQQFQNGIHIYDNNASLIYSGFGSAGPGVSHSPQTCKYQGEVHLCFYQGEQMLGWGHGHGLILDKHYQVVKSVQPSGTDQASSDMHEFKLIDEGKRALMTQFHRSVYDLCDWNICDGLAYIQEGVFQEVDVESGNSVFTWHSLEHVQPSESYVAPASTEISGDGRSPTSPWDYFHINSIDKNADGDYLISARHVSAIYKISQKDGRVLWRLGGAKSDFELDGFSFSFQHDARFISDNDNETLISLFDNGSNGFNTTQSYSTGLIVKLDHTTKVAQVIHQVDSPGNGHLSRSQGSYQILPNGNEVMGWGSDAYWSEHTPEGEVVFYGMIGTENVMNYRVHKFDDWVGLPLTKPALWAYSQHGCNISKYGETYAAKQNSNTMFLYVSWNGHTQIARWSYHCSSSKNPKDFEQIGGLSKNGFETIYRHQRTYRYCYSRAIDKDGNVLGTTDIMEIYVPREEMRNRYCDELACRFVPDDETRAQERLQGVESAAKDNKIEEETEFQQSTKPSRPANGLVYALLWAGLVTVAATIMLFIIKNYTSVSCGNSKGFNIVLWKTWRGAVWRKATHEDYRPLDDDSDEEVVLGHYYDEANHLMRRKSETESIQGNR